MILTFITAVFTLVPPSVNTTHYFAIMHLWCSLSLNVIIFQSRSYKFEYQFLFLVLFNFFLSFFRKYSASITFVVIAIYWWYDIAIYCDMKFIIISKLLYGFVNSLQWTTSLRIYYSLDLVYKNSHYFLRHQKSIFYTDK